MDWSGWSSEVHERAGDDPEPIPNVRAKQLGNAPQKFGRIARSEEIVRARRPRLSRKLKARQAQQWSSFCSRAESATAKFMRRNTERLFEAATEITLIGESDARRDFCNGEIALLEQARGFRNAHMGYVGNEVHSRD